jgi:autotransporter translocation and assembly factor TamB
MHAVARVLRWFASALGLLIVLVLAAFGLLQTQAGQAWLARTIAQTVSSADFAVLDGGTAGVRAVAFRR